MASWPTLLLSPRTVRQSRRPSAQPIDFPPNMKRPPRRGVASLSGLRSILREDRGGGGDPAAAATASP